MDETNLTETYIFDLDDTIIDSSIYARMHHELLTEIVKEKGISEIELQKEITKLKQQTGKEKVDTFDLCKNLDCIELYYTILEKYARHTYTLKTPTLPKIFAKIKAGNKKIGIISRSQERTIRVFLDRFNLSQYVTFVESGKKDTVLFWIQVERRHSLSKAFTLVIDDSEEILKIAQNAGYKVLNIKDISSVEGFKL
jgi:phosphoglycolate phosphatase-like HAD superfamily hydrolase